YVTIDGTDIYTTPVFHKRSSETFTLLFNEKDKMIDILEYVQSKTNITNPSHDELRKELDRIKNEIK
ncbi:MAG: hypothetical protein LBR86_04605, partial [Tannerella sp.]|nr:hypothetical protein [Tannerella sp.]